MADEYHKIGTTLRSSFDYPDPTTPDAYVTGLTQADFTITLAKNGTIGQATTGITITDLVTPAGKYGVVVSGTTGFVAATGTYELAIQRTSDASERWVFTYRVTSDGTGAGSWGDASFTAVAANGRITSGGNPLDAATVRIFDSTGALYVQTVSTSTGVWGPIYFPASGTYTISAQKSGYTVGTGTITVVGSTATGPGADIALTASATTSGLLASNLWAHFKRALRDRSGAQADLLAQYGTDDALAMISQEREWPWYHTIGRVDLVAYYNTGTIAVVNGSATVTLTSGTFPSWAAYADIYLNGQPFAVSTRDSDTQVTLESAWGEASASGQTYVIARTSYTLPTDLVSIDRVLLDQYWPYGPQPVSMATLTYARTQYQYGDPRPGIWAVSRDQLVVWPYPSAAKSISLLYYRRPALLTSASDEADWDPMHLPLIRRAIEYQVSLRGDCIVGTPEQCMALYRDALLKAEWADKTATDRGINQVADYSDNNARSWGTITS